MFEKFENYLLEVIKSNRKRKLFLFATTFIFIFSVWMIYSENVLARMLPGKNNNTFSVYVKGKSGTSVHETNDIVSCIVDNTIGLEEVTNIETFVGTPGPLDFAGLMKEKMFNINENHAEIVVNLTNKHDREIASFNIVQNLRHTILENCSDKAANTNLSFVEPPAGPPVLASIVAEVYSNNDTSREYIAEVIEDSFNATKGLVDVDILSDDRYTTYNINLRYDKILKSGLNVQQVNKILYLSFEGMQLSVKNTDDENKQIPIFLRFDKNKSFEDNSLEAVKKKLGEVKLMNSKGMMVPLMSVIEVEETLSNKAITNKNLKEMVNVIAETDMVSQVYPLMDARNLILDTVSENWEVDKIGIFDLEFTNKETGEIVTLLWDGEMKVTLDTFRDLGIAFISALIFIFLLMFVYYRSFALSAIVLLGSFLSIIGVIFGHWVMDIFTADTFFLTATSLIGFIALIGISSRNSLLLIDFAKQLHVEKGFGYDKAIAHATAVRAKPIFLTAAAIILASTLLASDAVFGGLGVALIFGTVTAVIASLIVVPILLSMTNLEKHFPIPLECED